MDLSHQWCYLTLLDPLLLTSCNSLIGIFLKTKVTKISGKFQGSVTDMCHALGQFFGIFWRSPLKVPLQELNLSIDFTRVTWK